MAPFAKERMHCWSFTKKEKGARVDMRVGDWDKEQFEAEVQAHDDIISHSAMQNKLKNTRPERHECDTNFYLHLEGNFFACVGNSRHKDSPGKTHGWIQFGSGCNSEDRKLRAVKVLLNCMGFYMDEGPASGGTTGGASSSSQPASGGATSSSQPLGGGVAPAGPPATPPVASAAPAMPATGGVAPTGRWTHGPPAGFTSKAPGP